MSLMGQQNLSSNLNTIFIDQFKQKYPKVDEGFWKKMENEINVNSLIDISTSVYEKNFSDKEIDELLKFYKSPLGKKMVQNAPMIMQEIESLAQNWAMEAGQKINDELTKSGYLQPPPPPSN